MTDIIKLAREAGFDLDGMSNMLYTVRGNHAQLERFAELVAKQAEQSWQPIETAPKDMGTYLFLCNRVAIQGFRDATGMLHVCIEAGANGNPPWRLMRRKPTHWMPLPQPPEAK
jgi:DNA-binding transcriptional MerR regulator